MTAPGATARAWLALDRAALRSNVRALQTLLPPGCSLMPVLKANAYGHGAAPVGTELERRVTQTAKTVYRALGCSGFARVDLFLTPEGGIVFNEVNTIPGFTEHSRFPGMFRAAGMSFAEVVAAIVDAAVGA